MRESQKAPRGAGTVRQPRSAPIASGFLSSLPDWMEIWACCRRRIDRWRAPPHWSPHDWSEEVLSLAAIATCQAIRDYDPTRNVPLRAFVYRRILAGALTRHRQEWAYALHLRADPATPWDAIRPNGRDLTARRPLLPGDALARMSGEDRWLIDQLFWRDRTEAEIADQLGISQQAVNKRKRRIFDALRRSTDLRDDLADGSWL